MAIIYATESQIVANLKGLDVGVGKTITTAILSDILAEESQVIDQHLQPNYTLDITDADALIFLRKICIDLVVYRVAKILMPKEQKFTPDGKVIQDISYSGAWNKAMRMLKEILSREIALPNISVKSRVFVSSTLDSDNVKQTFEKDVRQW